MHKNIRKHRLLVISDTSIFKKNKEFIGFEPVVRELEAISHLFDEIIWLGSKVYNDSEPLRKPASDKIKIIQMPSVRHHRAYSKFLIPIKYLSFIFYIIKYLPKATHVHTRAPSHPAIIGILISLFDRKRIYWHKYAGDWVAKDKAFTYKLQRKLLLSARGNNIRVTVNGKWPGDPEQIFAFENPCIYETERLHAVEAAKTKDFSNKLSLLYVGHLAEFKGILKIIEAIETKQLPGRFEVLYIVGNGPLYKTLQERIAKISSDTRIELLGHLNRTEINKLYGKAHVVVLPSSSEGFPKVIAEGAAFGCIPVVTDISSLSQYIVPGQNGFLIKDQSVESISNSLSCLSNTDNLQAISLNAMKMCTRFTYEYFIGRLETEIFSLKETS